MPQCYGLLAEHFNILELSVMLWLRIHYWISHHHESIDNTMKVSIHIYVHISLIFPSSATTGDCCLKSHSVLTYTLVNSIKWERTQAINIFILIHKTESNPLSTKTPHTWDWCGVNLIYGSLPTCHKNTSAPCTWKHSQNLPLFTSFTNNILSCRSRKSPGVTNNFNDALFHSGASKKRFHK